MDGPEAFGGPEVQARLKDFLNKGSRPVYMGWGSMPFPPRLLVVAITALKNLGLRAVVAKGWSHADLGMLVWTGTVGPEISGVKVSKEEVARLRRYAESKVLFVDQAPHEWLFPRCSCTVHHGGAGTTAAALRAGVPTVVVPVAYDQPYHGDWVSQMGVGIKASHSDAIQTPELEAALKKATSDKEMQGKAKDVAEALRKEPGVAAAVTKVRQVIQNDVQSGAARARWELEEALRRTLADGIEGGTPSAGASEGVEASQAKDS
mmetsp:Transcript_70059/g.216660  ORF Transcript_70059/g.216660 Transcript_70059/m.216660 type:complete len:263 (-) Transcript_70059:417-1205(-)